MFTNTIYVLAVIVLCTGLYIMIVDNNYIRRIIGLGIFQTSCLIFFISLGKVNIGIIPFEKCNGIENCAYIYSAALPHVLMLTAIVVGFSTLSVGLALIYRIYHK
jgi:multicomponent Na+:H+ antiporter subunit C